MLASKARRVSLTGHQLCQGLGACYSRNHLGPMRRVKRNEPVRKAAAPCRGFLLGELPLRLRMGPSLYPRRLTLVLRSWTMWPLVMELNTAQASSPNSKMINQAPRRILRGCPGWNLRTLLLQSLSGPPCSRRLFTLSHCSSYFSLNDNVAKKGL